ncbi:glutamate racemase [Weissella hellenica]|uniref:glutamate racemase n=1 Tax=Weissella hellenica TaxID=46256 RepID=UPI00388424C7
MDNRAIGYIDSGIGGLSVVKKALEQLPNEQVYYVGDTARMPYGPRQPKEVKKFTWELVNFLTEKNIKLLVIACNTATAAALDELTANLDIPVVGVIQPGVQTANKVTKTQEIGVIATQGTVNSQAYYNGLKKVNKANHITQLAAPRLVEIAEQPVKDTGVIQQEIIKILSPIKQGNVDTLVLGCTHFPLLASYIQRAVGEQVKLVDAGAAAVSVVANILKEQDIQHESLTVTPQKHDEYYTTGNQKTFLKLAQSWLQTNSLDVKHLAIQDGCLILNK